MASSKQLSFVLRESVEFGFHSAHFDNVKISANRLLAERTESCGRGVIYGAKVVRGTVEFEVEMIVYDGTMWDGSLKLGVMQCKAGSEIELRDIPQYSPGTPNYCMCCADRIENMLVGYSGPAEVKYGSTNLNDLREGDRLGLQVSRDCVLTFFVNGKSQGVAAQGVYQDGYDLYPVVDVYASCRAVRITRAVQKIDSNAASEDQVSEEEIAVLKLQSAEKEDVLLQLRREIIEKDQFIQKLQSEKVRWKQQIVAQNLSIQSLQSEKERFRQQIVEKDQSIQSLQSEKDRFEQQVERFRLQIVEKDQSIQSLQSEKDRFEQQVERFRLQIVEKDQFIQSLESEKEGLRQQIAEKDQFIQSVRSEKEGLRQQVATLRQQVHRNAPQPQSEQSYQSKFWEVPREEVSLNMQKILGTGAWGFVMEGTFRGQRVAVKCLHDMIREPYFLIIIRKEIDIMAQIRHPNLVMLIAAVIDAENDPLVVTELLDMSLRKAYERKLLEGSSKLNIFRDIASALNYLHLHHHGEIIHRDVSSANVLLEAKPNNQWKAKLSDFGSAKLAMEAKTKGPGAPVYAAPEIMREMGIRQTAKVDVYSYGILLCEVTMGKFPLEERLPSMVQAIRDRWVFMHNLITACIQEHPDNRPTMSHVLTELNKLRPN